MAQSLMIETDNLARYFGEIKAVDGITFSASSGDVLGFLGPNGAGKSTTMKMLTCFLTPTGGQAKVNGYDVVSESQEVRKSIGYLPENVPIYGEMRVDDFLNFVAEVRGIAPKERKQALDRVIDLVNLQTVTSQRIETLSKGFRRRVGIAQAIIHDPKILILDEPTDGLDPNQKHEVRELINNMAQDKCIILSTHILEEVDAVCNRAIIIAGGKIVADETPEELRQRSRLYGAVTLSFRNEPPEGVEEVLKGLSVVNEVEVSHTAAGVSVFTVFPREQEQALAAVINEAESRAWSFDNLRLEQGELDEVFREITQ